MLSLPLVSFRLYAPLKIAALFPFPRHCFLVWRVPVQFKTLVLVTLAVLVKACHFPYSLLVFFCKALFFHPLSEMDYAFCICVHVFSFRWWVGCRCAATGAARPCFVPATPEIATQGPPQAACLGLALRSPEWHSRPQAAFLFGRVAAFTTCRCCSACPLSVLLGSASGQPCPTFDKSGGEGGTLRLACCTA